MSKTRADDPDEVLRRLRLELIPGRPKPYGLPEKRDDLRTVIHVIAQALRDEAQGATA